MPRRLLADQQSMHLLRLDESGAGTPVQYGYQQPMTYNVSGTTAVAVTGMHFDTARRFNGTTDYIEVVHDFSVDRIDCGFWFRCSNVATGAAQYIVSKQGLRWGIIIDTVGGLRSYIVDSLHTYYYTEYDINSLQDTWIYTRMIFDGKASILYVNDAEVDRNEAMPANSTIDVYAGNIYIGNNNVPDRPFVGDIAEVIIGPEPRFPYEVLSVYDLEDDPAAGFTVESDSIAVYNFDDDVGGTVVDATGNHNGTVVGTVPLITDSPFGKKGSPRGRYFSGSLGNYITIPHHTIFNVTDTQALTIEVLAKVDGAVFDAFYTAASKWGSTTTERNGWRVSLNTRYNGYPVNGGIGTSSGFYTNASGRGRYFMASRTIYAAVIFDPLLKLINIYANGYYSRFSGTVFLNYPWSEVANTNNVILGQYLNPSPANPFIGELYSVGFTSRAKTLHECEAFYTGSNMQR